MKNKKLILQNLVNEDWEYVSEIYQQGLDTGHASFETIAPDWNEWNEAHIINCRFVAILDNTIVGWAALSPVSSRCVYAGVVEVSVYVSNAHTGQNIGTILLNKLIEESEQLGIWTLQAGIFPENIGSIIIHERTGFRKVGFREKIGQMNGIWRNTMFLERRSTKI